MAQPFSDGDPSDSVGSAEESREIDGFGRDTLRLVAFRLSGEWYAVEAAHVRGIEEAVAITSIPRAPEWLLGVFNLRGSILPLVDASPLLGLPRPDGKGLLVVFQCENIDAALRIDDVDEIYEVSSAGLEPPLPAARGTRGDLMRGQIRVRNRLIGVIDLSALVRALLEG